MAERVGLEPSSPKKFPSTLVDPKRLYCQPQERAHVDDLRFSHQHWKICWSDFAAMSWEALGCPCCRAAEEVRYRTNESRDRQGTEPGVAGRLGAAVAGNRIVERRIRPADRTNRQGSTS